LIHSLTFAETKHSQHSRDPLGYILQRFNVAWTRARREILVGSTDQVS
jgi:hypothetical protein